MERVLVFSAHAVDFVWRCGGTISQYTKAGDAVKIIDITCGQRGESNDVWKRQPGINEQEVAVIREVEAKKCADILGAEIEFLGWSDHLLSFDDERITAIAKIIREYQPTIILTHWTSDPLNYDHPNTAHAVLAALRLANVMGTFPGTKPVVGVKVFMFEPDQPEFCGFAPDTYIDITDVAEKKIEAMASIPSQEYLVKNYTSRSEYRAYLAGRVTGNKSIQMAEAYVRFNPFVAKFFQ